MGEGENRCSWIQKKRDEVQMSAAGYEQEEMGINEGAGYKHADVSVGGIGWVTTLYAWRYSFILLIT